MKENSIEEAIERLEYIDRTYSYNNHYCIWDLKYIETLLSEYKRLKQENEELKGRKQNIEPVLIGNKMYFIDKGLYEDLLNDIKNNYIPVQKVKDKIEELTKEEQELQNSISKEEREEYSDANISYGLMNIDIRRSVLKELLEESEEQYVG